MLEREIRHERARHARDGAVEKTVRHHGPEQFVAVVDVIGVGHDEAVRVAVETHRHVATVFADEPGEVFGMGGAHARVDVEAVGRVADRRHFGAELVKDRRRDVVGRPVGAIDKDLESLEVRVPRDARLAEFDVAPRGVVKAPGLAEFGRCDAGETPVHFHLHLELHLVGKFRARAAEEFDSVVVIWIVARRNHHARVKTKGARKIGDGGRRNRTAKQHVDARARKTRLERRLQHVARNACVLSDQNRRTRSARTATDRASGRLAEPQHEIRSDRALAHLASHAVRAEVASAHSLPFCFAMIRFQRAPRRAARHTASASAVSRTSCTRRTALPCEAPKSAPATLPATRSVGFS